MNLDPTLKNNLMTAMLRLSRKSLLYPRCFTLKEVDRDHSPVTAGHFGDIFKGKFRGLDVCLKVIKMYETSRIGDFLKVRVNYTQKGTSSIARVGIFARSNRLGSSLTYKHPSFLRGISPI